MFREHRVAGVAPKRNRLDKEKKMADKKALWINVWRAPRTPLKYEVTLHVAEQYAVEAVAEDRADRAGEYVCTIVVDPTANTPAWRLDLTAAAEELLHDAEIERRSQEAEARLHQLRTAGM
jgi:hypothetical protein